MGMQIQSPEEESNTCDCYQAGKDPTDLPCGGCSHCQKIHAQWETFHEDVDDVVPLAVRSVQHSTHLGGKDSEEPVANWLQALPPEEIRAAQLKDPDLAKLHFWMGDDGPPTRESVFSESPALRRYWLHFDHLRVKQGVLYYL